MVYPDLLSVSAAYAAGIIGTDFRAGTTIHESLRFIKNAGTKDIAHGQTRAVSLAYRIDGGRVIIIFTTNRDPERRTTEAE
jgi:hypothetical protein